jgi:hypothetical protein
MRAKEPLHHRSEGDRLRVLGRRFPGQDAQRLLHDVTALAQVADGAARLGQADKQAGPPLLETRLPRQHAQRCGQPRRRRYRLGSGDRPRRRVE